MRKNIFTTTLCITLGFAAALTAGSVDEKLFLEPHLSQLAGNVALRGGEKISATPDLNRHVKNFAEKLKNEGVIAVPASYDVVFTVGNKSDAEVKTAIDAAVAKIGSSQDPKVIAHNLNNLTSVSRATFAVIGGKFQLVTDAKKLKLGQNVWRKTPEGVSQEAYHSEEEYLVAIRDAGLSCTEIKRPCFFGEVKWKAYNASAKQPEVLGAAYKDNNPFTIFHVKKGS